MKSQVFALWPLQFYIPVCPPSPKPDSLSIHSSSPQSPLPIFSCDASSSSSDFGGWRVRLGAAIHSHHCREKARRNQGGGEMSFDVLLSPTAQEKLHWLSPFSLQGALWCHSLIEPVQLESLAGWRWETNALFSHKPLNLLSIERSHGDATGMQRRFREDPRVRWVYSHLYNMNPCARKV